MAITRGAKKAHRASLKKRVFNERRKKAMKQAVRGVRDVLKEKMKDEALKKLPAAYKAIDKAARRGVIKKNTASRKKSRLTAEINKLS
ncbi:MAG: 30S ribosomal protein S20 [Candidatus Paceibacterota bacterium]